MLGANMKYDEMPYEQIAALVDALPEQRKEALKRAITLLMRTFIEDEAHGVLLLVDGDGYLTTMGLNSTYLESAHLIRESHQIFSETALVADTEVKH